VANSWHAGNLLTSAIPFAARHASKASKFAANPSNHSKKDNPQGLLALVNGTGSQAAIQPKTCVALPQTEERSNPPSSVPSRKGE
jgi:hypothetical protein